MYAGRYVYQHPFCESFADEKSPKVPAKSFRLWVGKIVVYLQFFQQFYHD